MPKKKCIRNLHGCYMQLAKNKETKELCSKKFTDGNGKEWNRYRIYNCGCGSVHTLDILHNFWIR